MIEQCKKMYTFSFIHQSGVHLFVTCCKSCKVVHLGHLSNLYHRRITGVLGEFKILVEMNSKARNQVQKGKENFVVTSRPQSVKREIRHSQAGESCSDGKETSKNAWSKPIVCLYLLLLLFFCCFFLCSRCHCRHDILNSLFSRAKRRQSCAKLPRSKPLYLQSS